MFLHDADGRLLAANQAYLRSAGMSERQALGQPYWTVFPRRHGALPGCRHSQMGLQSYTDEFDVEGRGFRSDAYAVRD
ncbi:MAG TPA: PAS domain-containing protein, partial [Gammaproteobacteria bacterium]|nr:PAS domain-containing protein [Gammaproteobacteria bacterium]